MARIKDTSVEAVKAGADFVAVVEERTQLRKQGGRLVGRCPFHEERTPSFSVNPTEKLFYCFGCHQKGDAVGFVQEIQGLDFVGAVEWLAERFRIPLEYEETSRRSGQQSATSGSACTTSSTRPRPTTSAHSGTHRPGG